MDFVCIKKCFWLSLIEEGQVISVDSEDEIPLSVRPFFEPKEKVEAEKTEDTIEENNEIEKLQAELDALGVPYDRRWGKAKLENALNLARRDKR